MHNNKKIMFFLKSDKIFALFLKISSLCCEVEQAFSTFFGYCINIFQKSPSKGENEENFHSAGTSYILICP